MFSSNDYEIAAMVARASDSEILRITADAWDRKATERKIAEEHVLGLSRELEAVFTRFNYVSNSGAVAISWLLDNGWTPPEGIEL